jgi:hypothetical protein
MTRRRTLAWAAVALTLAATFAAYLNPHVVVSLANQIWSCF